MDTKYTTRNWLIAILVGGFVATFVMGYLHGSGILSEPENPLWHTVRDWIIVSVVILPVAYGYMMTAGKE